LQTNVEPENIGVVIVDDNLVPTEFDIIDQSTYKLRSLLALKELEFSTFLLKNSKTKGNSGTGAWNTGIEWAYKNYPDGYISILDDDDEYLPNHLHDCVSVIRANCSVVAAFQQMQWKNDDGSTINTPITHSAITAENFFIGNPGVQGSNMFFKTSIIETIAGFDEKLPNTTDRDLLIRFLWYLDKYPELSFEVLEKPGIIHYNHSFYKVNNDLALKHIGLNIFYDKYSRHFSVLAYEKSIARASNYFNYQPSNNSQDELIIIGMPLKNNCSTVERAINSFLSQRLVKRKCILLILNDSSSDGSADIVDRFIGDDRIKMIDANLGNVSKARNYIHSYIKENIPSCCLIGRLDADDYLYSETIVSEIEAMWEQNKFDVLFMGNKQSRQGEILEWVNKADHRLLDHEYLSNRLFEMSEGNAKAELPSCNTFIRPFVTAIAYPDKKSAEDHWYSVLLLMQKDRLKIEVSEDKIYCVYSLDGTATASNKSSSVYRDSRVDLYNFFIKKSVHAR
jgi:Glycosyl transferase family 2